MRWLRDWWSGRKDRMLLGIFGIRPIRSVSIAAGALDTISSMACSAHPKEMLAFLAASKGNREGHIHIDEIQLQAYEASEDSASVWLHHLPTVTSIVGTVHSHPGGSKRPSDADLHLWSRFGYLHAIIGEPYRPQDIAFYTKEGRRVAVEVQKPTSIPRRTPRRR